jgi:hypothetical protein
MTTNNEAVKGEEAAPGLYSLDCRQGVFPEIELPADGVPGNPLGPGPNGQGRIHGHLVRKVS